jgi:antitoxin HicB
MLKYPIEIAPDDNGTLLVTCPDLPEVTTFGEDVADAALHARDAIEEAFANRIAAEEDVPPPSPARGRKVAALPALIAAKVELYRTLRETGVRPAVLAQRLGLRSAEAAGLIDLSRPSSLDQLEAAFLAVGKRLAINVPGCRLRASIPRRRSPSPACVDAPAARPTAPPRRTPA